MQSDKDKQVFKKGIWIKEQQGVLTIGSLDNRNKDVIVVSDELRSKLDVFESDMVDALYGDKKKKFDPKVLDIENLFRILRKKFKEVDLKISFENPERLVFKCEFDPVFLLFEKLIESSISKDRSPSIYINASIVQDHFCIIYRDSESNSDPTDLGSDFFLIKNKLNGSVQFKKTNKNKTYYDIMIPSNS